MAFVPSGSTFIPLVAASDMPMVSPDPTMKGSPFPAHVFSWNSLSISTTKSVVPTDCPYSGVPDIPIDSSF